MSRNKFLMGIGWFILSLVISNFNDGISKYLGVGLHPVQITFMRFLFGVMTLIPFMVYFGRESFKTSRIWMHGVRGLLLFMGICLWNYGLTIAPITVVTLISFTVPLAVLILAKVFLKERIGIHRTIATLVGFIGVSVVLFLQPGNDECCFYNIIRDGGSFVEGLNGMNKQSFLLIISAILFASLDIINKKYVVKESMLSMLFYSALVTSMLGVIPALRVWVEPTMVQYGLMFVLGCGANLILYCLLKAFSVIDASAVAPFRYFELVVSAVVGLIFFSEVPTYATLIGAVIIIPSTLYIARYESKREVNNRL